MCLKEIGVCAQNILDFTQHGWEELYDHLMNKEIFTLTMNKMSWATGTIYIR